MWLFHEGEEEEEREQRGERREREEWKSGRLSARRGQEEKSATERGSFACVQRVQREQRDRDAEGEEDTAP